MPLVDSQVFTKLLDILHEVPGCVLFEACRTCYHQLGNKSLVIKTGAYGVDFPDPLWSKSTIYSKSDEYNGVVWTFTYATYFVLLGIEEGSVLFVTSTPWTAYTQ